jgi:hypothetical protein
VRGDSKTFENLPEPTGSDILDFRILIFDFQEGRRPGEDSECFTTDEHGFSRMGDWTGMDKEL